MIEAILLAFSHYWLYFVPALILAYSLRNYFDKGLNKYPGPFLANFTDAWRFIDVYKRRPDITQIRLHRQLGNIVRLGPNTLSFSDPAAIKTIYGLNKGFVKSGFYPPQQATFEGKRLPSLFSTTDEAYHANLRRSVNSAFSMSALVQYEPNVNEVIDVFLERTRQVYAAPGIVADFALWLQYFAFDVIGQITYSKQHGFVEKNEDIDGMIAYLGRLFSYVAPVGQMPFLDLLLLKNPIVLFLDKLGYKPLAFPITKFARARMAERLSEMENQIEKAPSGASTPGRGDLLSMFLKAQAQRPEFMTSQRVLTMAVSMAFAGSETTAISLAAVFYHLLKNPACYRKLQYELDEAMRHGRVGRGETGLVTWSESQTLPYLDAVIKESMRVHPAAGLPLERITPPGGIEICGEHIPAGTIVGCSAWVIHRHEPTFVPQSNPTAYPIDKFVPERWLDASSSQRKEMEATMFQFGAGSRTCIGKNISLLEIYKLVPNFLLKFDIELEDPEEEWKLHNAWFVKQLDFNAKFSERQVGRERSDSGNIVY
ncbi:hypothetical protein LTS08_000568 [Lithohypha guttulata]|nr:hypothetical protein LTS08_000568 [Lithohypha guttulata]